MRLGRPIAMLLATSPLLFGLPARSEPANADVVELSWSAPPGCPSREAVMAEVTSLAATDATNQHWNARAVVTRDADGMWVLRVTTVVAGDTTASDRENVRELRAATCAEVAHATAVILAVAV